MKMYSKGECENASGDRKWIFLLNGIQLTIILSFGVNILLENRNEESQNQDIRGLINRVVILEKSSSIQTPGHQRGKPLTQQSDQHVIQNITRSRRSALPQSFLPADYNARSTIQQIGPEGATQALPLMSNQTPPPVNLNEPWILMKSNTAILSPPTLSPPTLSPPTLSPPTQRPPTLRPPTLRPPTVRPPILKQPTLRPPTLRPPTLRPPTLIPPTVRPPILSSPTLTPLTFRPPTLRPPPSSSLSLQSSVLTTSGSDGNRGKYSERRTGQAGRRRDNRGGKKRQRNNAGRLSQRLNNSGGLQRPTKTPAPRPAPTQISPEGQRQQSSITGSTFVRWGKFGCPQAAGLTSLLYNGYAASSYPLKGLGGSTELLCLPYRPTWNGNTASTPLGKTLITAAKFSLSGHPGVLNPALENSLVLCAVCYTQSTPTLMIPGRVDCPLGWARQYYGHLMSSTAISQTHYHSSKNYCVDIDPDAQSGHNDSHGQKLTFVQAGSCFNDLYPCTPYTMGNKMACTVCTKD